MKANKEFGSFWRLGKYPQCLSRVDMALSAEDLALVLGRPRLQMERQRQPIPAMSHRIRDKDMHMTGASMCEQNELQHEQRFGP